MPPAPKHNWNYLYEVYKKMLEEKPDISYAEFARQNGVGEVACRSAFNRLKKKEEKRALRANSERSNGRKKPSVFDDVSPEEAAEVVQQVCSARVVAVHAKVLTNLVAAMERLDVIQECEKKINPETMRDIKDAYQSVNELLRALQGIMPFILELKDRTGLEDILSKLQGREYDVTQAALEVSKLGANLPEALRIMLSKTPPIMIANSFEVPSTESLDQRALEVMQGVQQQWDIWLPERRQEVIELKKELKGTESFTPEKNE